MARTIVAVISDLMFESRVREQALALGYDVRAVDTLEAVQEAVAAGAVLAVVDLHVAGLDWRVAVDAAQERGVPVLAFGRHTEARLLRSARKAGCDRVVARSTLVEELPSLILELAGAKA